MGTVTERILISDLLGQELHQRHRERESYNDLLNRLLAVDRELLAGFGAFCDTDRVETLRIARTEGPKQSTTRVTTMADTWADE